MSYECFPGKGRLGACSSTPVLVAFRPGAPFILQVDAEFYSLLTTSFLFSSHINNPLSIWMCQPRARLKHGTVSASGLKQNSENKSMAHEVTVTATEESRAEGGGWQSSSVLQWDQKRWGSGQQPGQVCRWLLDSSRHKGMWRERWVCWRGGEEAGAAELGYREQRKKNSPRHQGRTLWNPSVEPDRMLGRFWVSLGDRNL